MFARIVGIAIALSLAGCISSSEMPLSANVWRIETDASGLLFVGQAGNETLKRAAELTLQQGYSHFKLVDYGSSSGRELAGFTPGHANTTVNVFGNMATGTTTYAAPQPIMKPTSKVGVTVVMFRPGDPGFEGSLDAAQILAQMG